MQFCELWDHKKKFVNLMAALKEKWVANVRWIQAGNLRYMY